jgi:hypothetical protein
MMSRRKSFKRHHLLQLQQQPPVRDYCHKRVLQHRALLFEGRLSVGERRLQLQRLT